MNEPIRNPWGIPQPQKHHDAPGIAAKHPKILGDLAKDLGLADMGETVFHSLPPITQTHVIDFGLELLALDMGDSLGESHASQEVQDWIRNFQSSPGFKAFHIGSTKNLRYFASLMEAVAGVIASLGADVMDLSW